MTAAALVLVASLIVALRLQQLKRLRAEDAVRRLIAMQESDRSSLARELHDNLSQKLALLCIDISRLAGRASHSPAMAEPVARVAERANDLAVDVHCLSHGLYPPALELLGLSPAIERLCLDVSGQCDIRIDFQPGARTWAEYWTGFNGVPTEVTTYFGIEGDTHVLTAPDGTVYKETYAGSSDAAWMRGLVKSSEVRSGGVQQKLSTVAWTQDNTSVVYKTNPRVVETNVYDSVGNQRRTTIDYSVAAYAQFGLPYFIREYAANATTPLRTKYIDYNLAPEYLERRIVGLVDTIHVVDHVTGSYVSKVSLSYDWDNQSNTYLIDQGTATQHDNANYGASFRAGRGNLCAVQPCIHRRSLT